MTALSGKGRRDKGIVGEREVMAALTAAGYEVRGLEGRGDHLATRKGIEGPIILHVEVKRQETLRIDEWHKQASIEAPQIATAVCIYRRSHEPWRVVVGLDEFLRLLK